MSKETRLLGTYEKPLIQKKQKTNRKKIFEEIVYGGDF